MKDFATKSNLISTLTAEEFNNYIEELENLITQSGQMLDNPVDIVTQLGKAVAAYAAISDYYTDSGSADAYDLNAIGSFKSPLAYTDGMRVRFVPDNANTGASTVDVDSLGVKDIKKANGAMALTGGELPANRQVELIFVNSADAFTVVSNETDIADSPIGRKTFSPGALDFIYSTTSGASGPTQVELAAGKDVVFADFDQTTEETIQFSFRAPKSWDAGTVIFQVFWAANSTSTNSAVWGLQGYAVSDDDPLAGTYGSEVTITDANKATAHDLNISPESTAVTIGGTPAKGDLIRFKFARKAADGSDDLAADARVEHVNIFFNVDASTDD